MGFLEPIWGHLIVPDWSDQKPKCWAMRTVFELTSQSKTSKNGRQGQLAPNSNNLANNLALDGNPSHFNVIIIQDWNLFTYASWQFKFTVGSWIISQSLLIGSRYQSSYSPVYSFIAIVGASLINQLLVKWVVSSGNLFLFSSFRTLWLLLPIKLQGFFEVLLRVSLRLPEIQLRLSITSLAWGNRY